MAANTGKHKSCKGLQCVQRSLLGEETEDEYKCQTILGSKIPVKVKMANDGVYTTISK